MTLTIGILQADSVLPQFQGEHGDYPGMFATLLQQAATAQGDVQLELENFNVTEGEFPASVQACDGYVITGSRHSVYDDLPWIEALAEFVGAAMTAGIRIVGICFGHQLLAHFFGGTTQAADIGWCVGVHDTKVTAQHSWMQPPLQSFGLISSHQDQVQTLPQGAQVFASSEACPNAGFVLGERVMTLQGHPEFEKPYSAALMGYREDILGPEIYSRGMASLDQQVHSEVVGQWLVNFLRGC